MPRSAHARSSPISSSPSRHRRSPSSSPRFGNGGRFVQPPSLGCIPSSVPLDSRFAPGRVSQSYASWAVPTGLPYNRRSTSSPSLAPGPAQPICIAIHPASPSPQLVQDGVFAPFPSADAPIWASSAPASAPFGGGFRLTGMRRIKQQQQQQRRLSVSSSDEEEVVASLPLYAAGQVKANAGLGLCLDSSPCQGSDTDDSHDSHSEPRTPTRRPVKRQSRILSGYTTGTPERPSQPRAGTNLITPERQGSLQGSPGLSPESKLRARPSPRLSHTTRHLNRDVSDVALSTSVAASPTRDFAGRSTLASPSWPYDAVAPLLGGKAVRSVSKGLPWWANDVSGKASSRRRRHVDIPTGRRSLAHILRLASDSPALTSSLVAVALFACCYIGLLFLGSHVIAFPDRDGHVFAMRSFAPAPMSFGVDSSSFSSWSSPHGQRGVRESDGNEMAEDVDSKDDGLDRPPPPVRLAFSPSPASLAAKRAPLFRRVRGLSPIVADEDDRQGGAERTEREDRSAGDGQIDGQGERRSVVSPSPTVAHASNAPDASEIRTTDSEDTKSDRTEHVDSSQQSQEESPSPVLSRRRPSQPRSPFSSVSISDRTMMKRKRADHDRDHETGLTSFAPVLSHGGGRE